MFPAAHIEALNENGFVAVSSDYRLSPTISVLDGPVSDSIAAYYWAQNELPVLLEKEHGIKVNGKNIVTLGHSCGGGLALLMVSEGCVNYEDDFLRYHALLGFSCPPAESYSGFIRFQISSRSFLSYRSQHSTLGWSTSSALCPLHRPGIRTNSPSNCCSSSLRTQWT